VRRFMFPAVAMIVGLMGSTAWAHPQLTLHSHVTGFEAGAFHPFLGIDHLLAMVAVGILAAKAGGRALWLVPSAFLICLVVGGAAAMSGWELHASVTVNKSTVTWQRACGPLGGAAGGPGLRGILRSSR
jgi:urease accessory protein